MKSVVVLCALSMTLRLCDKAPAATPGPTTTAGATPGAPGSAAPGTAMAAPGMAAPTAQAPTAPPPPAHGGVTGLLGSVPAEVAATPDGHLSLYAAHGAAVQVNVVKPDGSFQPVPVAFDQTQNAYTGMTAGITAGQYPVQVWYVQNEGGTVAQFTSSAIALAPPATGATPEGGINIPLGHGHGVHLGGRHGSHVH